MLRSSASILIALVVIGGAAACSSTKLVNQWENPQYVPARFDRILVIGVTRQPGIRRAFEDEFVTRLNAQNVDAVPSYSFIPEDGQVDENRLRQAIQQANADCVLMTRPVRVERKTDVRPGYWDPAPGVTAGLYPWYSAGWRGYYEPPRVYQYDVYISETTLYDARRNALVWSGTAQTTAPGNLNKEIQRYVATVVRALKKANVLA